MMIWQWQLSLKMKNADYHHYLLSSCTIHPSQTHLKNHSHHVCTIQLLHNTSLSCTSFCNSTHCQSCKVKHLHIKMIACHYISQYSAKLHKSGKSENSLTCLIVNKFKYWCTHCSMLVVCMCIYRTKILSEFFTD